MAKISLITNVLSFTNSLSRTSFDFSLKTSFVYSNLFSLYCIQEYSGYSKGFRYEIVQSALHAYKMIQTLDQTGVKPMYRPKEWRQNERRKEKEEKRRSWYRKGNYSSVIFVPATPESSLKRSLDEDVKKSGLRIRIVEKPGMSVKRVLQRSDPFKKGNV